MGQSMMKNNFVEVSMEKEVPQGENYIAPPKTGFVAGVEVQFPTKPYPCQYGTMNMVIRGLRHMTNTLIECPTGSGKTLSLICATLAWQRAEAARLAEVMEKVASEEAEQRLVEEKQSAVQKELKKLEEEREANMAKRRKDYKQADRPIIYLSDSEEDMEDFQMHSRKTMKMERPIDNYQNTILSSMSLLEGENPCPMDVSEIGTENDSSMSVCDSTWESVDLPIAAVEKPRVAKIFYCSRTHQQLQQVVRELRKTAYKDVNMTILSSREHTCIQSVPKKSKSRNKTQLCRELLDPVEGYGCMFKSNVHRMGAHQNLLQNCNLGTPWDLEDLVAAGRRVKSCPYFSARELVATSDIVFCPYLYLIDPKILSSMKLELRGSVILLDEAHNIEDCCRDAAGYSLSYYDLEHAIKDCIRTMQLNLLPNVHRKLADFMNNLMSWMTDKIRKTEHYPSEKEMESANTFGGVTTVASFEEFNITMQSIMNFKILALEAIAETNKEENKENTKRTSERYGISVPTTFVLEGLYLVLGFMYDNNLEHIRDYYVVLSKTAVLGSQSAKDHLDDWQKSEVEEVRCERGYFINFLCMNPGVIFQPIAKAARSIVLASGTLSPLLTFSSELSTFFTNELQASHIVAPTQVWVGVLGCGPRGSLLNAGYRYTEQPEFRNELGKTILNICKVIPFGVLCFLPSYGLLENLRQYWMRTGLWSELEEHKDVLCESRSSRDLPGIVEEFSYSVRQCELGVGNGPLLFAIMRGKVSEGMDFADNRARGVITVGIPYPHVYDIQVSLKRKYNDANVKQGLKSGSQWYETQAYRALNQALGRCIRHKNDWGALIIIENRFITDRRHSEGLSKWIRDKVQRFNRYQEFDSSLKSFIQIHKPIVQEESEKCASAVV